MSQFAIALQLLKTFLSILDFQFKGNLLRATGTNLTYLNEQTKRVVIHIGLKFQYNLIDEVMSSGCFMMGTITI